MIDGIRGAVVLAGKGGVAFGGGMPYVVAHPSVFRVLEQMHLDGNPDLAEWPVVQVPAEGGGLVRATVVEQPFIPMGKK